MATEDDTYKALRRTPFVRVQEILCNFIAQRYGGGGTPVEDAVNIFWKDIYKSKSTTRVMSPNYLASILPGSYYKEIHGWTDEEFIEELGKKYK